MAQPPGEPPQDDDPRRRADDQRAGDDHAGDQRSGRAHPDHERYGGEQDTERIPRMDRDRHVGQATATAQFDPPTFDAEELLGLTEEEIGMPPSPRRALPIEDEPSALVSRYLFPTERYRGEWRRHWIHLSTPIVVGTLATFVLGYVTGTLARQDQDGVTGIVVLIWLIVMGWVVWRVADWYYDRFILTNKRVMVVAGLITRRVGMMPLLRVTDMKYEQSPLGRALNYGTFVIESAGQEQALREIKHLPNPNELYLRVVEEMYEPQAVEARLGRPNEEGKPEGAA